MIDFIEYVVSELKNKRLSKGNALSLIKQFSQNSSKTITTAIIHPLLHTNTSDLYQQSYSSVFKGTEHFLEDHQVQLNPGESIKILPGVAYLEMACLAIDNALPGLAESSILELKNIVWLKPFFVTEPKQINIALTTTEEEKILFEIYSEENGNEIIHCEGEIHHSEKTETPTLNVEGLKDNLKRGTLASENIYKAYDTMGLLYGPSHKVISTIYQGENELVAALNLPEHLLKQQDNYLLHPGLTDGALQASIGFLDDLTKIPDSPKMPFALENIRVYSACTAQMFAWIRYSAGSSASDKITKLDIDICDTEGNVCVQLQGFTSKQVPSASKIVATNAVTVDSILAKQAWEPVLQDKTNSIPSIEFANTHIVFCGLPHANANLIQDSFTNATCTSVALSPEKNMAETYREIASLCFDKTREVIKNKPKGKTHFQIVVSYTAENEILTGISGLFKTASLENPLISGQVILVDKNQTSEELIAKLRFNQTKPKETAIKYEGEKRLVKQLQEIEKPTEETSGIVFKEQGVYMITGGMGGLGILFAKEILKQTIAAKVILTGRSELTTEKAEKLKALTNNTGRVTYQKLNILDAKEVNDCINLIINDHKYLNGIIHSAGMIADNYILKKTKEEFQQVLEPKVNGAFNLTRATEDIDLDFIALFSSGVSVLGNPGQSDYAVANGFLDCFATFKNNQQKTGQNQASLYSINWPLWQNGGMALDKELTESMKQLTGIYPLNTTSGIQAFYQSIHLNNSQTLVVEGEVEKIRKLLFSKEEIAPVEIESAPEKPTETATKPVIETTGNLLEKTKAYLRKQFSGVLKIPVHKIDTSAALEKYGIDSVVAMNLTGKLEKTFGTLSKTLFFEYQTIDELSEYISENFQEKLSEILSISSPAVKQSKPVQAPVKKQNKPVTRTRKRKRFYQSSGNQTTSLGTIQKEPIAIVGLSGRYPESENIEAFWNNLRNGKDCITEVPKERWDWRDYYNENDKENNKHTSKWGGFIKGVDEFDPRFFNISPREASYIDPQERLFLQHAWMAVEDAGLTRASLQIPHEDDQKGQVGVYVGVMYGEYNLSGSLASIANRVSYFLNLHGPSMTLDTMCSSSLTAIHLACQDLILGRTSMAIAGGVNVSIDANKYSILSSSQFISGDGHCQSFGEGGDGYIPGEGVGAVILKKLSDAEKDNNHIYGIIKGSALNHGGKTNGYTVPNPIAQASAISRALKESKTDARHISFVEAHGTGTKLGDPIEIAALSKAYKLDSEERKCLIGSSKSNIGHCESAAGIAGFTKVLLQMKNKQIVPSLHSARLNPNIDFDKSPFEVNQTLKNWERHKVDGKEIPRTAGLSSFGAGGSNAHIIIQEYTPKTNNNNEIESAVIIPLSARTQDQLQQKALELSQFIDKKLAANEQINIKEIAYTLQLGREAMDHRLAFIVTSTGQLAEKLKSFVTGEEAIEDVYKGNIKENKETLSLFNTDSDFLETVDKWILQEKYAKLTELWVKGLNLEWSKFYQEEKPLFVSLPTYPFAREKYWNSPEQRGKIELTKYAEASKHPLLHTNTSNLDLQSFSTTFSGTESFIKDYQIKLNGEPAQKALPLLAGIEMARAAVQKALPPTQKPAPFELQEIVWGKPFILNGNKTIDISLFKEDDTQVGFEILSKNNGTEIIHSQGQAVFGNPKAPVRIDLESVKSKLKSEKLEGQEIYKSFQNMGLHYGESHQAIKSVLSGVNHALAQLKSPKTPEKSENDYVLHPVFLDSLVQAAICLATNLKLNTGNLHIPVSAETVYWHAPCQNEMYAWVRYAQNNTSQDGTLSFDADLCDLKGNVCIQLKGLALQQIAQGQKTATETTSISLVETIDFPETNLEKPKGIALSSFLPENSFSESILPKPKSIALVNSIAIANNTLEEENIQIKKVKLNDLETPANGTDLVTSVVQETVTLDSTHFLAEFDEDNYTESNTTVQVVDTPDNSAIYSKKDIKHLLTNTLAEALYLQPSEIDGDKSFIDLGLDSIVGVEWIKTINKKLDLELSSTKIYDYATVNALAQFLEKEIEKLKATSQKEAATT